MRGRLQFVPGEAVDLAQLGVDVLIGRFPAVLDAPLSADQDVEIGVIRVGYRGVAVTLPISEEIADAISIGRTRTMSGVAGRPIAGESSSRVAS